MDSIVANLLSILEDWWASVVDNIPQIIAGILVLIVSFYLSRLLSRMLRKGMRRRNSDPELTILLSRIVRWTIIILGVILALEQAGQDVSALIAGLGIAGFTIGFALQDVSSNLVAGLLLLYQQPFELEDAIEVAGYSGTVKEINLRATEMLTWEGLMVLIPNKDVFTNTITNYTRSKKRRLNFLVGISYESDVKVAEKVLLDALTEIPILLKDPAPSVKFESFGESTFDLGIYVWFDTEKQGLFEANNAAVLAIKTALESANIDMPFPTRKVLIQQE
ncbi:MAG: mechanosensitive ion channel [Anaerolineales bacterium]|jgi:small conductance mechanosensitive channel